MLAITVESPVEGQSEVAQSGLHRETEIGALHKVVIVLVEGVLIDMSQRSIELAVFSTSAKSNGVLGLWSPVVEHESSPVGIREVLGIAPVL